MNPDSVRLDDSQLALVASGRGTTANTPTPHEAIGQLYDRYAQRLLAFLSSRVPRNDLDDVHQSVWQKIWEKLPTSFSGGNFRAWMFQIARNHLIDLSRKRTTGEMANEHLLVDDNAMTADSSMLLREEQEVLKRCLEALDATASTLVRLRLAGEAYQEICEQLRVEISRAHKIFHHAKLQLQDCVKRKLS